MVAQLESNAIFDTIVSLQAVANHLTVPTFDTRVIAPDEYQSTVDEALQLVYSQHHRIISHLYPLAVSSITTEQLRSGPLGEDLTRLAQIADGRMRASRKDVFGAIDAVVQLLFWPVGSETYIVPRSFWEQPLGKMLSLAKLRSCEPHDLMSIGEAARILNVTRPVVYRWLDDKTLEYVRDDISGRTFVLRQDVEAVKANMDEYEREHQANTLLPKEREVSPEDPDPRIADLLVKLGQQATGSLDSVSRLSEELDEVTEGSASVDESSASVHMVRLHVEEEPLTTSTLGTLTSVVTTLHTKLWLIHQDRFADLIVYTQTRDERFDREANLRILSLRYSSPLEIKLDVGVDKVGDALQKSLDAVGQVGLRYKEQRLKNEAAEVENRQRELQAQADLLDQEQDRQIARDKAALEAQKVQVAIDREQLALQKEQLQFRLDRVTATTETAMSIIGMLRPDVTDPAMKAMLAQTLVPQLLQGSSINGLELALPISISSKAEGSEIAE